ncbi:hypothetical protein LCGC14_1082340 [marine sediment metagenome]|uniref:Bacterial type II secretion system protein E domain-containing protein n=1 Tax=marine sediment metagenome TaxID=412755 RepID=A0A0F9PY34_9ZZZZ
MKKDKRHIGQILIDAGLINEDQLKEALNNGQPLSRALVQMGLLTETQIATELSKEIKIPFVDLSEYEINHHAATKISEDLARRYNLVPIDFEEDRLVVAMLDPSNIFAIDDLRIITGNEINVVIATETDIKNAISEIYKLETQVDDAVEGVDSDVGEEGEEEQIEIGKEKGSPVVKMIDSILVESARQRANDIHIEPQEDGVRIRYRVDGVLHDVTFVPKKMQAAIVSRIKIMAHMDIAERRVPQDGRFGLKVDRKQIDFRVASLPTVHGEKLVLRLLEKESIMIDLNKLGLEKNALSMLTDSLKRPYGAVLVTGPTGCGKTTTLYGALRTLNDITKNLITVEDPVEYKLPGVNQVQINTRAGLSFAAGLRSILRHDPDIVMIGEIRDYETAKISIESALTGHLVLSTLHTNDAAAALARLTEMKVEPFLAASAIECVVAQRLARRLCKFCAKEHKPQEATLKLAGFNLDPKKIKFYEAVGCKKCSNTGYRGRVGLFEVLRMNEALERLAVARVSSDEIKKEARKSAGLVTLREDGFSKVAEGLTTIEEIVRVTV